MSEQVKVYELSDPLSFDVNRTDRFVRYDDHAALQAECARETKRAEFWLNKSVELESDRNKWKEYAGTLENDRNELKAECERLKVELDGVLTGTQTEQQAADHYMAECERLRAELECPHRLARHSKRLVEQLRAELAARPTVEAYDAACKALWKHRDELAAIKAQHDQRLDGSPAQKSFWAGFEAAHAGLHGANIRSAWEEFKTLSSFPAVNPQLTTELDNED